MIDIILEAKEEVNKTPVYPKNKWEVKYRKLLQDHNRLVTDYSRLLTELHQEELMSGDIVKIKGLGYAVITHVYNSECFDCLLKDGLRGYTITDRSGIYKTGEHIDLSEIFKGLEN